MNSLQHRLPGLPLAATQRGDNSNMDHVLRTGKEQHPQGSPYSAGDKNENQKYQRFFHDVFLT